MPLVLVVEEDPATAWWLRRLLESRGVCHIKHASTVAGALAMLEPPPDWVILDMNLADGLGLAVLEAIRKAGLPTRVVVSSATDDSDLMRAVAALKPDVIIPKPLDPKLLPIGLKKDD